MQKMSMVTLNTNMNYAKNKKKELCDTIIPKVTKRSGMSFHKSDALLKSISIQANQDGNGVTTNN